MFKGGGSRLAGPTNSTHLLVKQLGCCHVNGIAGMAVSAETRAEGGIGQGIHGNGFLAPHM